MPQHVNIIKYINALIWYYMYAIKGKLKMQHSKQQQQKVHSDSVKTRTYT